MSGFQNNLVSTKYRVTTKSLRQEWHSESCVRFVSSFWTVSQVDTDHMAWTLLVCKDVHFLSWSLFWTSCRLSFHWPVLLVTTFGNRIPTPIDFQAMCAILSFQHNSQVLSSHQKAMENDSQLTNNTYTAFDKEPSFFCCLDSPFFTIPSPGNLADYGCTEITHHQPVWFLKKSSLCSLKGNHVFLFFLLNCTPANLHKMKAVEFGVLGAVTLVNLTASDLI